ncbi:hypothetical protein HK098_003670 [Nowakowskiella sp. JEL0407]|nr:hypothetical protein HK098_003670 [Nowakowskiella sp. JEL0407]
MRKAPFGTLLGVRDSVEVYSSNYNNFLGVPSHIISLLITGRASNNYNGHFTGMKWQCVELARRYLIQTYGVTFPSIQMAYHIFELSHFETADEKGAKVAIQKCVDHQTSTLPHKGALLIWKAKGFFSTTGHVAVVVDVHVNPSEGPEKTGWVDIIEQNVHDSVWPEGQDYSRRLEMNIKDGVIGLNCTYRNTKILGWINLAL